MYKKLPYLALVLSLLMSGSAPLAHAKSPKKIKLTVVTLKDPFGQELIRVLTQKNQDNHPIAEALAKLLDVSNRITSVTKTFNPQLRDAVSNVYKITALNCNFIISSRTGGMTEQCLGGGEFIITETGGQVGGGLALQYTTELRLNREGPPRP